MSKVRVGINGFGRIGRLVLTHKDRLLRFGAELVFAICEVKQVEVVILNQGDDIGADRSVLFGSQCRERVQTDESPWRANAEEIVDDLCHIIVLSRCPVA